MSQLNRWYDDSRFDGNVSTYRGFTANLNGSNFVVYNGSSTLANINASAVSLGTTTVNVNVLGSMSVDRDVTIKGDMMIYGNTVTMDVIQATVEDHMFTVNYRTGAVVAPAYGNVIVGNVGVINGAATDASVFGNTAGIEIYSGSASIANAYMLSARDSVFLKYPNMPADSWINLNQSLATGDAPKFQAVNVNRANASSSFIASSLPVFSELLSGNLYAVNLIPGSVGGTGANLAQYSGKNYVLTVNTNGSIAPIVTSATVGQILIANAAGEFNIGDIVAGSGVSVVNTANSITISAVNSGSLTANIITSTSGKLRLNSANTAVTVANIAEIDLLQPQYAIDITGNRTATIIADGINAAGISTGNLSEWAVLVKGLTVGALIEAKMTSASANNEIAEWRVNSTTVGSAAPFIYTYGPVYPVDSNIYFVQTNTTGNVYARISLPLMGVSINSSMTLTINQTP